ncbi:hypothetical protein VPH35_081742 [Triticum aestivum]
MASVALKLSRVAWTTTSSVRFSLRLPGRDLTMTAQTRPLLRCIATLPSGDDSHLPMGAAADDLEDEVHPDLDTVPYFDEKDLASDETLWALYEPWCCFHGMARDHDEMTRSYTKGLTQFSDLEPEEFFGPRRYPRTHRTGSRFITNDRDEVKVICTDGCLEKHEGPVWIIPCVKQP